MTEQLSERLRPKKFEHLMQSTPLITALNRMVEHGSPLNMIFYGPPGLGKTSAARILLDQLGCDKVLLNGSVDNGIDLVRRLGPATTSCPLIGDLRIIFIDEADYLSRNAQAGLRGMIEAAKYCRFLLTANEIGKLSPAIRSRCTPISFDIAAAEAKEVIDRIFPRVAQTIEEAGYTIEGGRLRELLYIYFPDVRAVANRVALEAEYPQAA